MSPKKHIPFTYRQIGVFIFLLLNCFLTTVSFIKATDENSNYAKTAGFPSQHLPIQDTEKNSPSNYPEEQQQYHITLRGKQGIVHVSNITHPFAAVRNSELNNRTLFYSFASSKMLVRPAYYTLLSLFKLF